MSAGTTNASRVKGRKIVFATVWQSAWPCRRNASSRSFRIAGISISFSSSPVMFKMSGARPRTPLASSASKAFAQAIDRFP